MFEIGRDIGRRSLLIPTEDGSSIFVAEHARALSEQFMFPAQSPELLRKLASKRAMHALCVEHGENMSADGKPIPVDHRATNIFRREAGKWKLVHHHTDISEALQKARHPDKP